MIYVMNINKNVRNCPKTVICYDLEFHTDTDTCVHVTSICITYSYMHMDIMLTKYIRIHRTWIIYHLNLIN